MTKIITLSLLAMSLAFGADAEAKLPASAQAVLDKAEAAVAANRAAYDKANQKPLADAEKALRAEMEKHTKAGKLNEALAIQKVLEGLRESVVARVDEKAKDTDVLGDEKKALRPKDIKITSALFGADNSRINVAAGLTTMINNKESIVVGFRPLGVADPAPHQKKNLIVKYTINGVANEKTFDEGAIIDINAFGN